MSSSPTSSSSSEPRREPLAGVLDVSCNVEVVLGTATITVGDCLRLQRHSVVRLAQLAGADLHVRVHGIPIATGEVVIVEDSTAIRITQISPPTGADA